MKVFFGKKKLKAQLVFEFVIAVVIFFGIVIFALNYLSITFYGYRESFYSENRESKATQIAEFLVLNKGNWSAAGIPSVIGLAEDWPVLNLTKINWFETYCNSKYQDVKDNLGIGYTNNVGIIINSTSQGNGFINLVDCSPNKIPEIRRSEARRYALLDDGNITIVSVYVW